MTSLHDPIGSRFLTAPLAKRWAAASTILNSAIAPAPIPSTSASPSGLGRNRLGERAEAGHERLRQRLHVTARNGAKEDEFEELVVSDGAGAGLHQARPQPLAMPVIVRRFTFAAFPGYPIHRRRSLACRRRRRASLMQMNAPSFAAAMKRLGVPAGFRGHRIGARSAPVGESVKIS
jgi:hypothetical protein